MTAELNEVLGDPSRRERLERRFWAKVSRRSQDECWPWIAARTGTKRGFAYGAIQITLHTTHAHRVAWALSNAQIPDGATIRHSCDYSLCCNPAHLVPGTQADNVRDMVERGRKPQRFLEFDGRTQTMAEWAKEAGIKYFTLANRLHARWSVR